MCGHPPPAFGAWLAGCRAAIMRTTLLSVCLFFPTHGYNSDKIAVNLNLPMRSSHGRLQDQPFLHRAFPCYFVAAVNEAPDSSGIMLGTGIRRLQTFRRPKRMGKSAFRRARPASAFPYNVTVSTACRRKTRTERPRSISTWSRLVKHRIGSEPDASACSNSLHATNQAPLRTLRSTCSSSTV